MSVAIELQLALDHYAAEPADPYWIEGESYCHEHAQEELAKRPGALLEGGYSSEEDSCVHCHTCGKLLDYTLTNAGTASEIDHFRTVRFRQPLCKEQAFHVARMIGGAQDNPDAIRIAKRAVAKIPAQAAS